MTMNEDIPIDLDEVVYGELEPLTWYPFVSGQLELLRTHIKDLENYAAESIAAFNKGKVATDTVETDEGYDHVILGEFRGIQAPPDELDDIFEHYYPNLQRRSGLLILCSFLEHRLDQLCELFAKEKELTIFHTDLTGTGIYRARRYLIKVVGLKLGDSPVWQEITLIQKVRNIVVHKDGKLINEDQNVLKYIDRTNNLSRPTKSHYSGDIEELDILAGYLDQVLDSFDSYCREVQKAIDASSA